MQPVFTHLSKAFLAVLSLAGATAAAQAASQPPNVTILRDDIRYVVAADGSYRMDEAETMRINTEQGIKERGQAAFAYSTSLQSLDIVEAYTTLADGRRLDVPADKILVQQSPQSANAPTFDDGKVKTIVFPAVEVGATITLHVRRTQNVPLFAGQFSLLESTNPHVGYEAETIVVDAPEGLTLHVDARGLQGGRVAAQAPGRQLWRWELGALAPHPPEIAAVGSLDYNPRLVVSTFANYAEVGRAYAARAVERARVTPTIQKLADQITAGRLGHRAKAEALYQWVSANIRYVAIFLDVGGVVPHAADEIVAARYGDCKDHSTLLEALLGAEGIRSSVALVNAADVYDVSTAASPTGIFNHAITYLPEFQMFLDSTSGYGYFGALPLTLPGKTALVVDGGDGQAQLIKVPDSTPKTDDVTVRMRMALDGKGTIAGTAEVTQTGSLDVLTRSLFASLPKGAEPQVAAQILAMSGQNGSGTFALNEVHELSKPFGYGSSFVLPDLVLLPGPGALVVPQGLGSLVGISSALLPFGPVERKLPMVLPGRRIVEDISVSLPAGMKLQGLPAPFTASSPFGNYEARYALSNDTLTIRRELDLKVPGMVITPTDYLAVRRMAQEIQRDLRRQLLY